MKIATVVDLPAVAQGSVRFILAEKDDIVFYLEIPLAIITSVSLKPLKFLRFLGWAIIGVEGHVSVQDRGPAIADDDATIGGEETYFFVTTRPQIAYGHAIDMEAVRLCSSVPSESSDSRDDFREALMDRDPRCIFCGTEDFQGVHIIPFRRGDDWLRIIVNARPHDGENLDDLQSINDVRNGFLCNIAIHDQFDRRRVAVLKTPNLYLDMDDIPPRHERTLGGVEYPENERYTLQWVVPSTLTGPFFNLPNSLDAAFATDTEDPKPSAMLLHYIYAASFVRQWGHGIDFLTENEAVPRPPKQIPAPMGTQRTVHNRRLAIEKRENASRQSESRDSLASRLGSFGRTASQQLGREIDADDLMFYLCAGTKDVLERRRREEEDRARRLERWRRGGSYAV